MVNDGRLSMPTADHKLDTKQGQFWGNECRVMPQRNTFFLHKLTLFERKE